MSAYKEEDLVKAIEELNIISADELEELVESSHEKGVSLEELLVGRNVISDLDLGRLISDVASIPFVRLSQQVVAKHVLNIIPEIVAKSKNVISFKEDAEGLHIATSDPSNIKIKEFLEKKLGIPVKIYYATKQDVEDTLTLYAEDVGQVFEEILSQSIKAAQGSKTPEPSIVKIVDTIISYAYKNRASDVHVEPYEDKSLIRFRIDGVLHDIYELPSVLHPQVVTRVKVLASLRTDEHASAQDGKIEYSENGESLDIRVSVVPVSDGEKVVMRLLSERSRQFSLGDLGLQDEELKKIESAYKKPHGMILATGPTGCGKTTTLYTILKILNKRDINIMTIEDPVEYDIEGVNQIQVNEKTGLTFANGLRSIVRQDPDIILVGEIRDEETADIAVNAAMTGHLVLSTLHTNDAATSIPRLLDLKVEPFLIASTVNVIIAQRLVRKICNKCRFSQELDASNRATLENRLSSELVQKFFGKGKIRTYLGKGCEICHHTGYVGRIGIFEVLEVNEKIRQAIVSKKDASVIHEIAKESGMTTMFEDGIKKVIEGETTIEEILRVTKD